MKKMKKIEKYEKNYIDVVKYKSKRTTFTLLRSHQAR